MIHIEATVWQTSFKNAIERWPLARSENPYRSVFMGFASLLPRRNDRGLSRAGRTLRFHTKEAAGWIFLEVSPLRRLNWDKLDSVSRPDVTGFVTSSSRRRRRKKAIVAAFFYIVLVSQDFVL